MIKLAANIYRALGKNGKSFHGHGVKVKVKVTGNPLTGLNYLSS